MFQSLSMKRDILICIALSIAIIIIYWQVKEFKFIYYDDNAYVTERPHVMSGLTWPGVKWAVSSTEAGFWHPLTWISLMLDRELFNYQAGGFHWTNVILHILNTMLLFALLKGATNAPLRSAFVALLFAVHPLHVESVAWVSQRKDLLGTFFGFASLWLYVIYTKAPCRWKYISVMIIFILGLMSKPMIVTFPFVMLLMDFWPLQRIESLMPRNRDNTLQVNHTMIKRSFLILLLEKIPLIALSFMASILVIFTERIAGALSNLEELTIIERCANAVVSYVKYIAMTFWPTNLAFYYPYPATIETGQTLFAIVTLIAITIIIIIVRRCNPYLFVGWFWYLGTLLPVIGLIQVGPHAMADRYSYLTIIGLFIMVVWGMVDLTATWEYKKIFLFAMGLLTIIGFSWCAWLQTGYWQNSITLFNHALKVTKGNYIALNNLGYIYMNNGEIEKGINYIKESIRVNPKYGLSHHNVGVGLYAQGHYEKAIEYLRKAQYLSFRSDETPRYLGDAYRKMGREDEAIEAYNSSLAMNSGNLLARSGLALALHKAGRTDEALRELREVLSYDPKNLDVRKKMMMILIATQNFDAVLSEGEIALSIDPNDLEIEQMMNMAYKQVKQK